MKFTKLEILITFIIVLVSGCMFVGDPPEIGYVHLTNEYGLMAAGFHANVDNGVTLIWDTGDGHKVSGNDVIYEYKAEGEYTVSLTATKNNASSTRVIHIAIWRNQVCFEENRQPGFPWYCDYPKTDEDWAL